MPQRRLPIATAMAKIQGAFTAGANAFVQKAAVVALAGGRGDVETMWPSTAAGAIW
jgi:hypothetical protein